MTLLINGIVDVYLYRLYYISLLSIFEFVISKQNLIYVILYYLKSNLILFYINSNFIRTQYFLAPIYYYRLEKALFKYWHIFRIYWTMFWDLY